MNIDKILLNVVNDKATKAEYSALEEWKDDSINNIEFLKTMMTMQSPESKDYQSFDKAQAWSSIEGQLGDELDQKKPNYILWIILAIALVSIVAYSITQSTESGIYNTNSESEHFALLDNSNVWLNRSTTLTELSDFSKERKVSLQGEAYFEVEHQDNNPFIITLNDDDYIKVIGTSFNVLNNGNDFELNVFSGHVQLFVLNRKIDVYKGDRVLLYNGSYALSKSKNPNAISWKNKVLLFEDTKLKTVLEELSDYYNVQFTGLDKIADQDCRLRTRFDNESLENVLSELEFHVQLKYKQTNENIQIISAICE